MICRALRDEYAVKRGLLLRMTPNELKNGFSGLKSSGNGDGFERTGPHYRTLLIDLTPPVEDIIKGAARRWRRALKTAESAGIEVVQGGQSELFHILMDLYRDMVARKSLVPGFDIGEFARMQEVLKPPSKMQIMVAKAKDEPVAALAASLVGDVGIGLFGATSAAGLGMGVFQLLNTRMMGWLKDHGARWYDFGGYDPERDPGIAKFKEALPGLDVVYEERIEYCARSVSALTVRLGEYLLNAWRTGLVACRTRTVKTERGSQACEQSRRSSRRTVAPGNPSLQHSTPTPARSRRKTTGLQTRRTVRRQWTGIMRARGRRI